MKVILDVDTGTDDALAIALATLSPEIELIGLTTVSGNVHVDKTSVNTVRVLEFLGVDDVPVFRGAAKPLVKELRTVEWVHGSDGLGDSGIPMPRRKPEDKPAAEFIVEELRKSSPGEITLIATGPLTNLAIALLLEPRIVEKIQKIIVMGGAFGVTPHGTGNITPVSEFNIYTDPEAAKIVFESGAKVSCVGLDVTMDPSAVLRAEHIDSLRGSGSKAAELAVRVTRGMMERVGFFALHDPMAVALAVKPELFKTEEYYVQVSLEEGDLRGQTIADRRWFVRELGEKLGIKPRGAKLSIASWVDGPGFLRFFLDRITSHEGKE